MPLGVTKLLMDWSQHNQAAFDELAPPVYHDRHQRARTYLRHERTGDTLQLTPDSPEGARIAVMGEMRRAEAWLHRAILAKQPAE